MAIQVHTLDTAVATEGAKILETPTVVRPIIATTAARLPAFLKPRILAILF